mgnify:CR=1 FL=1
MMANMLYQSHAGSWAITVLLFIVSYVLLKMGKPKGQKVTHMILRLFFVIMVVSGLGMLILYQFPLMYVVKGILAIWLIVMMERILARTEVGGAQTSSPVGKYWIQMVIALLLVVLLGFEVIRF